jgi:hypothetical protein
MDAMPGSIHSGDDFVRIMTTDNNGGYANDWLLGDLNANEIARLELGLKNHRVWRTKDGWYVGSNFPLDSKLIADETTFDVNKKDQSVYIRRSRWEKLMVENKGAIDAEKAMAFLGDHRGIHGRSSRPENDASGRAHLPPPLRPLLYSDHARRPRLLAIQPGKGAE